MNSVTEILNNIKSQTGEIVNEVNGEPTITAAQVVADSYTVLRIAGMVYRLKPGDGLTLFRCPACGRIHIHGGTPTEPGGEDPLVRRSVHCQTLYDRGQAHYWLQRRRVEL